MDILLALVYFVTLFLALKALLKQKGNLRAWALLVLLNALFWVLIFINVRQGYQADIAGTSGDGWSLPLFVIVALVTMFYHWRIFSKK